mmetsp:Transcript_40610/g.83257  ORF Transcript_40610/g.83257 Transcript_40610/m.83257 type:complete len:409 (-) Transcript_40610:44-1270(-)
MSSLQHKSKAMSSSSSQRRCRQLATVVLSLLTFRAFVAPASSQRSIFEPSRAQATQVLDRVEIPDSFPDANPQGIENRYWQWRGQRIRYQFAGEENVDGPSVLLVHGLFVNADHWRKNLPALAKAGFRVFAIDLLGSGYSSKPAPCSEEGRAINGENGRSLDAPLVDLVDASGNGRGPIPVPQKHPLGSVYNFFTWSEQVRDFTREIIGAPAGGVTLVTNSIGAISGLQAAVDETNLFNGVAILNPNFRELHVAEQPPFLPPIVSAVQGTLRAYGQPLFDALANPGTVGEILKEPYHDASTVTDELVDVLLSPLLTKGSADVVFDTLSYSAGPLPEQLLADKRLSNVPVWVCWGEEDPWTPAPRVKSLRRFQPVQDVVQLPGVGHCPHDEAPEVVNSFLVEFIRQLRS